MILRLATDEDLDGVVVAGLRRRFPRLDLLRVVEAGLGGRPDEAVLEWAAAEGRILFSRDRRTMRSAAYARITEGKPMPGLFLLKPESPPRLILGSLEAVLHCSEPWEWADQVVFIPL